MSQQLAPVPQALLSYATGKSDYLRYHKEIHDEGAKDVLQSFLAATLDEVRLRKAEEYAEKVLRITDSDDTIYFRQALLRREISGEMDFLRQRDHAAHTVNNYILGWFILEKVPAMKAEMLRHINIRFADPKRPIDKDVALKRFFCMWPFVSLLHDIGYLFEGTLSSMSMDVQNQRVKNAAAVVHDFFNYRFWLDLNADSVTAKAAVQELTKVRIPDFRVDSLAAVGELLCAVGNCENIRIACNDRIGVLHLPQVDILKIAGAFSSDAFDLWYFHYASYGMKAAANQIKNLKYIFKEMIWKGMPDNGLRVLDHGVCSGLLGLLYSTFAYQIYCGLAFSKPSKLYDKSVSKALKERAKSAGVEYDAHWWWAGLLWATAAAAQHNIAQVGQDWAHIQVTSKQLTITDDPLTYLGVLTDILQEWDRYSVLPESIFFGKLPLQGSDVEIGITGKDLTRQRVIINYHDRYRANLVRRNLDQSLLNWKTIVEILE
jgi:hypothetical protein